MTLRTSLVITGDSQGAERALKNVEQAMASSDAEAKALAAAYSAADVSVTRLATAQAAAKGQIDATKAAYKAGEIGLEEYNRQLLEQKTALSLVDAEHRKNVTALKQARSAHDLAVTGITGAGNASKMASHHVANLAYQFNDVAVMAASGQAPMMILIQQGSQIAQIMGQAGVGVGGVVKQMGGLILNFAKAHPVVVAIGAAVGVAAIALKGFAGEIDKSGEVERYAGALGLTRKEMKELEKTSGGFAVTAGDMWKGLTATVGEYFPAVGRAWDQVKDWLSAGFAFVLRAGQAAVSGIYAAFAGTFNAIKVHWSTMPAVMGEAVGTAANLAIKAIQGLLNAGVSGINWLIERSNSILGTSFSQFEDFHLRQVEVVSGATLQASKDMRDGYVSAFNDAQAGQSAFFADFRENILGAAKDRVNAAAEEIKADRTVRNSRDRRAESLQREIAAMRAAIEENFRLADAYLRSSEAAFVAEIRAKAVAEAIKKQADVESYVALKLREALSLRAVEAAKEVATLRDQTDARRILNNQIAQGLITADRAEQIMKDEQQLRTAVIALAVAEGVEKEKLAKAIAGLRNEQARSNRETQRAQELALLEGQVAKGKLLSAEIDLTRDLGQARLAALRGLTGEPLEAELARLSREHEKGMILLSAEADAAKAAADGHHEYAKKIMEAARAQAGLIDLEGTFDDQERAIARVNRQLSAMAAMLGQIGGLAGTLGGVLQGLGTGSFAGLGPIGGLLDVLMTNRSDQEEQASRIGDAIAAQFGINSNFAKTLGTVLQSASVGAMAGAAVFGRQSSEGQLGSAVGGILGQIGGKALEQGLTAAASKAFGSAIGGAIGSAVPVVGTILGGIAGSLVGGLLGGGNKTAGAVVTAGGYTVAGADKQNHGVASDLGKSVYDGLQLIADQLGATIGGFQVAIGTRGGEYRINTAGTSLKYDQGAQGFGQDSAAAISAAIADAIKDGALQGLSASAAALLKRGGDLEAQLQKALTFESVFTELERIKDPAGAAAAALEAEFTALKAIFDEAGASTEEYAKLEELRALKLAELNGQAGAETEDLARLREMEAQLMALQGDTMGALALAREIDIKGMSAAEKAVQQQIWAQQLANDIRAKEIELMEAQGRTAEATAARRQLDLAAMHEALRPYQEQIWAERELAAAREAAAQEARNLSNLQVELLEAQGHAEEALALQRTLQLDGMTAAEAATKRQVWAAQDAARANEELARAQEAAAAAASAAAQRMANLQVRLAEAQDNDTEALRLRREMERGEATEAEREMLDKIYAAEDAARKAALAAEARAAAQRSAEEKARAAEQAAAERARIAEASGRMDIELLQALGRASEALALQRKMDLAAMDASLRARQEQVWAAQEAAAAADKFREFGNSLRAFREELVTGERATADAYRAAQVKFLATSALAGAGDEAALRDLQGVSKDFLAVSKDRASSMAQYQRDLAAVLRSVDGALEFTDSAVDQAEAQLAAIERSNAHLIAVKDEVAGMRAETKAAQIAMTLALNKVRRLLEGAERPGGALAIVAEA